MGYSTRFTVTILDGADLSEGVRDWMLKNSEWKYRDSSTYRGEYGVKWYDYERDMCRFSKTMPGIVIVVHGQGEDDAWKMYVKDGLRQKERRVCYYNKFDANKLAKPNRGPSPGE